MQRLLPLLLLAACKPPPPAPEGLDASTRYLVREFFQEDAVFQAGVQGFLNWYRDEGEALVGQGANSENTDAFTVGDLLPEDLEHLPIEHGLDPEAAAGVVSLADMGCDIADAETLLLRPDQDTVFSGDWTTYQRTFDTPRQTWADATASGEYAPIREELRPFDDDFDAERTASTLLLTSNLANPEPAFGGIADLDEYPLYLDFRHGEYELDGELKRAFLILSYAPQSVFRQGSDQSLDQSYSIEINVDQDGRTLRMLAVWTEIHGAGLSSDNPLVLNAAVNRSLASSQRLSEICDGTIEIDPEP